MRFVILPLALATAALGASQDPGRATPSPVVLIVHGRGVAAADSAALRREWVRALEAGLAHSGLRDVRDRDIQVAWYADVLDPAAEPGCMATDSLVAGFGTMARGFLSLLGSAMEREGAPEGRTFLGDVLYVLDPATRCGARRKVEAAIRMVAQQRRPLVIVAYSLGSVVAHDALTALDAGDADIRVVSIGSPLGVPELRELLTGGQDARTFRRPRGVRSWVNVYDAGDPFAAPIGAEWVENRAAGDGADGDPHGIEGYLRDRETGSAVARALCAAAPSRYAAGCART